MRCWAWSSAYPSCRRTPRCSSSARAGRSASACRRPIRRVNSVGDPDAPGYDIELIREIADRLDLRVSFATNQAITRDFNPRSWGITRAQCQLIAGDVEEWVVTWMPDSLGRYDIAIGLWKGDLTLKRAFAAIVYDLTAEGFLIALDTKYDIAQIEGTLGEAPPAP